MKKYLSLSLVILGSLLSACQIEPDADGAADGKAITMEFTAGYTLKKTDILLLQENSTRFNSATYMLRSTLLNGSTAVQSGLSDFSYKLFYSGLDFQFGIANAMYSNQGNLDTTAGSLVQINPEIGYMAKPKSVGLMDAVRIRARIDGRPAYGDFVYLRPLATLKGLVAKNDDDENPAKGFLRSDSFLNVIYMALSDEREESVTTDDLIDDLDESRGKGNWRVSVITVPELGCMLPKADGTKQHTHEIVSGLTEEAEYKAYERKNYMVELQEHSGGLFTSICSSNFQDFMKRVIREGSDNGFFTVQLEKSANPVSIKVLVGEAEVEGWKYDQTEKLLYLPTTIAPKQTFKIAYRTTSKPGTGMYYYKKNLEDIEEVAGRELTPEELEFTTNIRPILNSNGCLGCHQNRAPLMDTYGQVRSASVQILSVIDLDPSAQLFMPRGQPGFDTMQNKNTLRTYLQNLP